MIMKSSFGMHLLLATEHFNSIGIYWNAVFGALYENMYLEYSLRYNINWQIYSE